MLVSLGKLHDGEEKSKEGDIDIGVHDEDGALYIQAGDRIYSENISKEEDFITGNFSFDMSEDHLLGPSEH